MCGALCLWGYDGDVVGDGDAMVTTGIRPTIQYSDNTELTPWMPHSPSPSPSLLPTVCTRKPVVKPSIRGRGYIHVFTEGHSETLSHSAVSI